MAKRTKKAHSLYEVVLRGPLASLDPKARKDLEDSLPLIRFDLDKMSSTTKNNVRSIVHDCVTRGGAATALETVALFQQALHGSKWIPVPSYRCVDYAAYEYMRPGYRRPAYLFAVMRGEWVPMLRDQLRTFLDKHDHKAEEIAQILNDMDGFCVRVDSAVIAARRRNQPMLQQLTSQRRPRIGAGEFSRAPTTLQMGWCDSKSLIKFANELRDVLRIKPDEKLSEFIQSRPVLGVKPTILLLTNEHVLTMGDKRPPF